MLTGFLMFTIAWITRHPLAASVILVGAGMATYCTTCLILAVQHALAKAWSAVALRWRRVRGDLPQHLPAPTRPGHGLPAVVPEMRQRHTVLCNCQPCDDRRTAEAIWEMAAWLPTHETSRWHLRRHITRGKRIARDITALARDTTHLTRRDR